MASHPSENFSLIEEIPVPLATWVGKPIFNCLKEMPILHNTQVTTSCEVSAHILALCLDEVK